MSKRYYRKGDGASIGDIIIVCGAIFVALFYILKLFFKGVGYVLTWIFRIKNNNDIKNKIKDLEKQEFINQNNDIKDLIELENNGLIPPSMALKENNENSTVKNIENELIYNTKINNINQYSIYSLIWLEKMIKENHQFY